MKVLRAFETSGKTNQVARSHIPEDLKRRLLNFVNLTLSRILVAKHEPILTDQVRSNDQTGLQILNLIKSRPCTRKLLFSA
jgi:hypothetical protein